MISFHEYLTESFDSKPYPWKLYRNTNTARVYRFGAKGVSYEVVFDIGDGESIEYDIFERSVKKNATLSDWINRFDTTPNARVIEVMFYPYEEEEWVGDTQTMTNKYDGLKVLSTIKNILLTDIKKHLKVNDVLYFGGERKKNEKAGSSTARIRIYHRMFQKEIRGMTGYEYFFDGTDKIFITRTR